MIRQVTPADAAAITRIYNPFVTDTTITFETTPVSVEEMRCRIEEISAHYPYYVWEDASGRVTGYAYVHAWKARAAYAHTFEVTIYLAPEAQGRGIGRQMIARLIDDSRQLGAQALIACITEGNDHSIHLHRSMGFEQVSHFRGVGCKFGKVLDVVDLEYKY